MSDESTNISANAGNSESSDPGIETINTAEIGKSGEYEPPRKRGRPRTKNGNANNSGKTQTKNNDNLTSIENLLSGIHLMLAASTKIDEFKLSEAESKQLAKSINEVQKHYDFIVDSEIMAWVGLITTCSMIYVPRVTAYNMRKTREAKQNKVEKIQVDTDNSELNPIAPYLKEMPLSNVS